VLFRSVQVSSSRNAMVMLKKHCAWPSPSFLAITKQQWWLVV